MTAMIYIALFLAIVGCAAVMGIYWFENSEK
jgi:hypothetical protein